MRSTIVQYLPLIFLNFFYYTLLLCAFNEKELRYDWSTIEIQNPQFLQTLTFPENFIFGIADSAFQTEGTHGPGNTECQNNWTQWEKEDNSRIKNNQNIGDACGRWTHYKEDIGLIASCGFDAYRFSIEWSKIEPTLGQFNEEAMNHYVNLCDEIIQHNLQPFITVFHHTWPVWFDHLGGFEKSENIKYFVRFCLYLFEHLQSRVKRWIIFNEPAGYVLQGYYRGLYPPGVKDIKRTGTVLQNMLNAHVEVYRAFKEIEPSTEIGLAKIFQPIDTYHSWNPMEHIARAIFDPLLNDVVLNYFTSGIFHWKFPGKSIYEVNPSAKNAIDFLGINYYSHTLLRFNWDLKNLIIPSKRPFEEISDDHKIIYPEGLMRACEKGSQLGIPLYIMENGVSDANSTIREKFINQHLYVTALACQKFDIRGYFYWTLIDNFEWLEGYDQSYGLFSCNRETKERVLRKSAQLFITFLQERKK